MADGFCRGAHVSFSNVYVGWMVVRAGQSLGTSSGGLQLQCAQLQCGPHLSLVIHLRIATFAAEALPGSQRHRHTT